MASPKSIILNHLSFQLPNTHIKFEDINLTFEQEKYGIIGKNGVGKTTFLKLLTGDLTPDMGYVTLPTIQYIQQDSSMINAKQTISDVLGITVYLQALQKINAGIVDDKYYELMDKQWDIEKRIESALYHYRLWPINLSQTFHTLSGGQKTKVMLAKIHIFPADFYILDEPTNNLDAITRQTLYREIAMLRSGVILVSHDRKLLNQCNKILEITSKGFLIYGGNYDFYRQQKIVHEAALVQEVKATTEKLNKAKNIVQSRMEKFSQSQSRGKLKIKQQIKAKGQYDKIALKSKKGKSENTNRRIRLQADRKLNTINDALEKAKQKVDVSKKLEISLPKTVVPNDKQVLNIESLTFFYNKHQLLIDKFNIEIHGAKRVAICGANGTGKSTLIKLIRGVLKPISGHINVGVKNKVYLDQSVSLLQDELSVLDNYLKINTHATINEAHHALASFEFRNHTAKKLVRNLSGGEKMRAGLAVSLMAPEPPQLILLDEPTNHLDLETILAIESALNIYQGAILAISHDDVFLKNIGIMQHIKM
ncbi:MAG: ABC transporter [Legionellales bacterium]|nr:ABC transporter [Legionellales bacterium]